jgi:hypothetical protein
MAPLASGLQLAVSRARWCPHVRARGPAWRTATCARTVRPTGGRAWEQTMAEVRQRSNDECELKSISHH